MWSFLAHRGSLTYSALPRQMSDGAKKRTHVGLSCLLRSKAFQASDHFWRLFHFPWAENSVRHEVAAIRTFSSRAGLGKQGKKDPCMSSVPLESHPSQPSWKPWVLRTSPVAPSPTCSTVPCVLEVKYTERAFSLMYSFVHLLTQYTFGSVPPQLALCETDTWSKSRGSSK